ncbi:sulfurtransferase TusA [Psychrobacter celer]|uniref:sulfurtransferase TusA n=1 Tax=Psychrobacter celer TaxID=306572 RepID=UPI003FD5A4E9
MTISIPDTMTQTAVHHHLDTQGLICPEPVMMLHRTIRNADAGEVIEILATDPATTRDIPNFCRHLGHTLVQQETLAENIHVNVDADEITVADDDDAPTSATLYRYLVKKKSA